MRSPDQQTSFRSGWLTAIVCGFATWFVVAALPAADIAAWRTLAPSADVRTMENAFAAELRLVDDATRTQLEGELIRIATDPSATADGRRLALRALRLCAAEKAAAALAPLLDDPEFAEHARLVIEGVTSQVADLALIAALGRTEGDAQRGVIDSLAARGTGAAFVPLSELSTHADTETAMGALRGMARVARDAADVNAIAALTFSDEALLVAQQEAFFIALARLADRGADLDVVTIPFPKMQARTDEIADLAVGVMLRINPEQAVAQIVAMFQAEDPAFHRRAAGAIGLLPDAAARTALMSQATQLPWSVWPALIGGLVDHGGIEARPLVRAGLAAEDEPTKLAAIAALGRVGEASDVPELLQLANAGGAVGRAALDALGRLPDRAADAPLIAELQRADSPVRVAMPDVLATRNVRSAVEPLFDVAANADRRLATECYAAIGQLGELSLVSTLWTQWTNAAANLQPAIERAIVTLGRRDPTGETTTWLIAQRAEKKQHHVPVIRLAAGIGDATALEFLRAQAEQKKPDADAVRAIARWRTGDGFPVQQHLIESGRLPRELRNEMWSGMLSLARERLEVNWSEATRMLDACMQLASGIEEQRQVLTAVGERDNQLFLNLLEGWTALPGIGPEAKAARDAMQARIDES